MENSLKAPSQRPVMNPGDWAQAALELIAEKGLAALGVEPLARRLGITKGSFYWHFSSRNEMLVAALARWEEQDSLNIQHSLSSTDPPAERLAEIIRRTGRQYLNHRVYMALCAAPNHALVRDVLRRVTRRRIDALIVIFRDLGLPKFEAWHRAHMAYTAYIGYLQLEAQGQTPERDAPEFEAYIEHAIQFLIRK